MAIYTIGDLHLAFKENKPMDIFGENWKNHEKKIKQSWVKQVTNDDLVVLPGDFSWAMHLEDTDMDFEYLNSMPGKKLMLKGNHDYWWGTLSKMRKYLQENNYNNIDFVYNNSYKFENYIIAGTRGWNITEDEEDKKIYNREIQRLELSLKDAIRKKHNQEEIIVFMHYPPITNTNIAKNKETEFIKLMQKYDIKRCYYGHLHGSSIKDAVEGQYFGINFKLVSCDGLNFEVLNITKIANGSGFNWQ